MSKKITILLLTLYMLPVQAQMKAPHEWLNYENVLQVTTGLRNYAFDVACIQSSSAVNIFWPGETVAMTIQVVNNTNLPIETSGNIEVIHYGTTGIPNDIWLPSMIDFGIVQKIPVMVNIPSNGYLNIEVNPEIPETFGGYALVLDLEKHGRGFVTSLIRTYKPDSRVTQYPKQSLDDLGADFLSKIGVKAIRMGISYIPTQHRDYIKEMEKLDKKLEEYHSHNITVLPMFMEGPALIPLGNPRSFLDENNVFLKTKQDYVWLPELDDDFKKFVKNICVKHGWPKGCVTGVHLWNEPWEGISISGWQSDMLRYREIYRSMADAVLEARETGVDVLIGGCDSHSNAMDKLFPDGSMEFLPIFDFLSIHYQGMESPCLYPEWNNRTHHKGRVLIWDTESWVGNTDDRIATVVATNRSAGYDRSMGIYGGYMISRSHDGGKERLRIRTEDGYKEINSIPSVWSPAAAMGAVQKMIGERDFKELLFKNGLPWIMLFDGYEGNPDDGTVVVCGDIGEAFGAENVLFRGVRGVTEMKEKTRLRERLSTLDINDPEYNNIIDKLNEYRTLTDGKLVIKSHPSYFLYDFYGNPLQPVEGNYVIPLSFQGYFLRTDGSKNSFARLTNALKKGHIDGYEPLDIVAKDLTKRIEDNPYLELRLTNILNRPIKGTLEINLQNFGLEYTRAVTFKPHETKIVRARVIDGKTSLENNYPLSITFDGGKDGKAYHHETMHVNLISKQNIVVDGKTDDWINAIPQTITAGKASISVTEAAWYPFKDFDTNTEGMATTYMGYDESYFYFLAKVADKTPHPGTYRFENRDDDEFFYPDTAYKPDPRHSFKKQDGKNSVTDDDSRALQNPYDDSRRLNYWEPDKNNTGIGIDFKLPLDSTTKVSLYLPAIDVWRISFQITDIPTGKILLEHSINNLWNGCYLNLELAGNVRVTLSGDWWYNVKLAALFFDEGRINTNSAPSAHLIGDDYDTKGDWKSKYGKKGFWVFGTNPSIPKNMSVVPTDQMVLIPLVWPENVRKFSYRKDPVLPDNSSGLGFAYDNVQIAFNVIPMGLNGYGSHPKGTMPGYIGYKCTDYEYALNQVDEQYGGGTEIWRLLVPGMPRKHFYPRQPKSPWDGPVKEGKLAIVHEGNTRITECAIPWSEIPDVKKALDEGKKIKFSVRINDNGAMGNCMELARERSVSKRNSRAFHVDWKEHWANEVEFRFE